MSGTVTRNTSIILRSAVWPLSLLNHNLSIPLDNQTYVGVTNPILALGNVHVRQCDEAAPEKGLCITLAEECVLSLCTRRFETSVVDGTTSIKSYDEDFGCLSQVHSDIGAIVHGTDTHCWQAGKHCDSLHLTALSSFNWKDLDELVLCPDGVVVQTADRVQDNSLASIIARPSVQGKLLTRLTGNQSASLEGGLLEGDIVASNFAIEYIAANGLEPVLAGLAASLTQQALLANTSERVVGTVWATETYVKVNWLWLIYPATLTLGAIVLLVLTSRHSNLCGLKTWKSSILPLLYRSLDPRLLAGQPVLQDASMMTEVASGAEVTLAEKFREDRVILI